ncbi:porin family protein [Capnocytophaga periodontitidis]|uniref:porin family protein n=1 Tax=Capnocytophaga periodontitidis TaxID=2795027 RepID=UPI0018E1214C|nr:porin family protein [Capnocytophaga periodontitidis]MBI1669102.1 PorT family protein [Capnocytophaga periodontitidis]
MKKIFIIAAMAVAAITTANAQEFKVGAKAGFLLSSVSEPEYSIIGTGTAKFNTAYRPGFHFGAFIEYGFNEKLWVEAGIDYAFQGANLKSLEVSAGPLSGKVDLNSSSKLAIQQLNVPLWFKYDINGFRPKVGVNLGFLSKVEFEAEPANNSNFISKLNYSLTPDKNFDLGLGFGAEYNLDSGLFFDATFNLGLTELSTKDYSKDGKNWVPMKFKNRVFQIGVGYKF